MMARKAGRRPRPFAVAPATVRPGRHLPWLALVLSAITISGAYYQWDSIAPIADLLRTRRGFSQAQIGALNAWLNLPNIVLSVYAGIQIDRIGAARASLVTSALCLVGAALTAWGHSFDMMLAGRLIFGIGEETLLVALLACLAQWFGPARTALAMALLFSLARVGSYAADISTVWAAPLYAMGWREPLLLATALGVPSLVGAALLVRIDRHRPRDIAAVTHQRFDWASLKQFDKSFWAILGLNVLFASAFFPFRSTFAVVYFQDAKHLTLAEAGMLNSWVFFAAIFATPVVGALADRFGHRAALLVLGSGLMPLTFLLLLFTQGSLAMTTFLMGVSFSLIPAVIWPATAMLVEARRLGTAFGIINMLQSLGLFLANYAAGWLNDAFHAGRANPHGYDAMLWLLTAISLGGFASTLVLWWRERGPEGHGLELGQDELGDDDVTPLPA